MPIQGVVPSSLPLGSGTFILLLLFDLVPVYIGICLGRSGLATRNRIDEFHVVEKVGMNLHG